MVTGQAQHWDDWNSKYRQLDKMDDLDQPCRRRMDEVIASLRSLGIRGAKLLEVGCGTGWLSVRLAEFGTVTAVDLGKDIIESAKKAHPEIDFRSGDIQAMDLAKGSFDVIVSLETFSHVPDQAAFVRRLSSLLKANGLLLLTTQNKYVFERKAGIGPAVGYLRKWVDLKTMRQLLRPEFEICHATTLEPEGHLGSLRLVNSPNVNRFCSSFLGAARLKKLKESAGFGQTIFVIAKRR